MSLLRIVIFINIILIKDKRGISRMDSHYIRHKNRCVKSEIARDSIITAHPAIKYFLSYRFLIAIELT